MTLPALALAILCVFAAAIIGIIVFVVVRAHQEDMRKMDAKAAALDMKMRSGYAAMRTLVELVKEVSAGRIRIAERITEIGPGYFATTSADGKNHVTLVDTPPNATL